MVRTPIALVLAATLGACASTPGSISPSYVSPLQYRALSCDDIRDELGRVVREASVLSGVQRQQVTQDAFNVAMSLVFVWPAIFLIKGDKNRAEIASLKGQHETLMAVANEKKCDLTVASPSSQSMGTYIPPAPSK